MGKRRKWLRIVAALSTLSLVAAACGGDDDDGGGATGETSEEVSGSLNISGSSTVEPITSLGEKFLTQNPGSTSRLTAPARATGSSCSATVRPTSATRASDRAGGAGRLRGERDHPDRARDRLDALSVIGNAANPVTCMTFGDLYALFGPESDGFENWSDADSLATELGGNDSFPDFALTIVAPGEESGTYGSFIDIVGTDDMAEERGVEEDLAGGLRTNYQISADDNVIVENAAQTEGGLGFVGSRSRRTRATRSRSSRSTAGRAWLRRPKP